MRFVVLGLSLSSSWGNGHATTWRALLRALALQGHSVLFLERDVPSYAAHRDLPNPEWCRLRLHDSPAALEKWRDEIVAADVVIVGSCVPDGAAAIERVLRWARGVRAFYDIDTPITLARLAEGGCAYLAPEQIGQFDLYLSSTGGPTLARLEQEWGARSARALYCSVDALQYRPMGGAKVWDLGYLGTWSTDRQPALEELVFAPARALPQRRFVVAGALYPADIQWPENVQHVEHLPPHAHPAFYSSLRWTVNITRADMRAAGYSPSVRLFAAAACAAPVLSDPWPGIETALRPDREMLIAHSAEDVCRALAMGDDARGRVATAGRARVLISHTAEHRAFELLDHVAACEAAMSESAA